MNRNKFGWIFAVSDFVSTGLAWFLFYLYRKVYIEPEIFGYDIPIELTRRFYMGIILIPSFWVLTYYLIGSYRRVYRRSRLRDLGTTTIVSFLGSVLIFFVLILDDYIRNPANFRSSFLVLLGLNILLRYLPRFFILSRIKRKVVSRYIGFNTVLIGGNQRALDLYDELESEEFSQGYKFRGYIRAYDNEDVPLKSILPELGSIPDIRRIIREKHIEDVIIAVDSKERELIGKIIDELDGEDVNIKIIPDMYDIVSGRVKMRNVFGAALIEIWPEILPPVQKNLKRFLDIVTSLFVLLLISPLYAFIAIWVKLDSPGPVFYKQERIGFKGRPFYIIKFRTMRTDAERDGTPQLSRKGDPRITKSGRILRKYRLDELPQFYNVLKGEMSLVGPRPERKFFIDQIVERAPHYHHLHKVKPGITSWGMVKYGYAQNVDQMIARMKYDILYIENMSLGMDFKILGYTVLTIIGGRGK